jgi:phosphoribosylformimino-5-aminoimidazole carboxamide ribotide isomerase
MIVIPSFEVRAGRVVDPVDGRVLAEDPVAAAVAMRDDGALFFQLVDLDAQDGRPRETAVLERFVAAGLPLQVLGGIRSAAAAAALLRLGVDRVVVRAVLDAETGEAARIAAEAGPRAIAAVATEAAVGRAVELGFRRLQVEATAAAAAMGPVLDAALAGGDLDVTLHFEPAGRGAIRELRPFGERGLGGVVLATACRTLGALVGS